LRNVLCNKHLDTPDEQIITVTILDTLSMETTTVKDLLASYLWWGEGNGSCDCNRSFMFVNPDDESNFCMGTVRFYIIETSHGCLNYLNQDYHSGIGDCQECKSIEGLI